MSGSPYGNNPRSMLSGGGAGGNQFRMSNPRPGLTSNPGMGPRHQIQTLYSGQQGSSMYSSSSGSGNIRNPIPPIQHPGPDLPSSLSITAATSTNMGTNSTLNPSTGGTTSLTVTPVDPSSTSVGADSAPSTPTVTPPPNAPPTQQAKELNTATICRIGQETVQEIVARIQEVFSYLKSLQPPVGSTAQDKSTAEKQQRLQDVMKNITQLFKRLHVCWDKCQENTAGMEYPPIESLLPLKEERDRKLEIEKKRGDVYKQALDENTELAQQLTLKNRHLKEIIDQMRNIVWEVNTMLAMREM